MRIVAALGGNALLRRGEAPTAEAQRRNVAIAAEALAPLAADHALIVTHGNGPQVGLLALQSAAAATGAAMPLDVLDAETEGMIGYLIEQELRNRLPAGRDCAVLLTQIEVDPADPAFGAPDKPIGPVYPEAEARRLGAAHGWSMAPDGAGMRRVVPSPRPRRILELTVIERLVGSGTVVICAGGGGIPVVRRPDGSLIGVEAVIDKDRASALLARETGAGALLMLTDVAAAFTDWGTPDARAIRRAPPAALRTLDWAAGSMGPKIEAGCDFVEATGGRAAIGRLEDAGALLARTAGTTIDPAADNIDYWPAG